MLKWWSNGRRAAAMGVFALVAGAMLAGAAGSHAVPAASAASCGPGACMRVDAVPGGGIDESASVGTTFTVDIVLQGTGGNVQAFDFQLAYDPSVLAGQPPTNAGLPSAAFQCDSPPPQGAAQLDDGQTAATFSCFSTNGTGIGDGPVAHVQFTSLRAGQSDLKIVMASAADGDAVTLVSCAPGMDTTGGGCLGATVSTSGGAPPPPPPPPGGGNTCAVAYAIDGETVQCVDGSRVRFIGVASPLGADPGADWARALTHWFLAGKTITLEQDVTPYDEFGSRYGYPHVTGADGADYNMSVLIIYVGMAHHLFDGTNGKYADWLAASQVWARTACWNMWAAGNPFGAESGCG
jgi:endonuclease YncB( thermonuclease family)